MILLVNGATSTVNRILPHKYLGKYISPSSHANKKSLDLIVKQGCIWGADNDCFVGFDEKLYTKMIKSIPKTKTLKYVTLPDVVGSHAETMRLFETWQPILKNEQIPVGFVLQDGCINSEVPYDKVDAIFIGGSTQYKLSNQVRTITETAKQKRKWVHMGRVNSLQRVVYAHNIGCDSFDGSGFSMFSKIKIPPTLKTLQYLSEQTINLFEVC